MSTGATRAGRRLGPWLAALAATMAAAAAALAGRQPPQGFPHERHARLFPTCTGCHAGVATNVANDRYPTAAACAQCHDGVQQPKVAWDGARVAPSTLRFDHAVHAQKAASDGLDCRSCHTKDRTVFMAAGRAEPSGCVGCHAHRASSHLAEDNALCATCHVPVAQAVRVSAERIARFPAPEGHARADFASTHGRDAAGPGAGACATCHARESCERCHANAAALPTVTALSRDARVASNVTARLAVAPPRYPVPASHRAPSFAWRHGAQADSGIASCANCHVRSGCEACHVGPLGREAITRLPTPSRPGQGVRLRLSSSWAQATPLQERFRLAASFHPDTTPVESDTGGAGARAVRPHPPGWVTHHGTEAAQSAATCSGCHTQRRFCSDCHDGEGRRRYHPLNFTARHPSEAYGREKDCNLCHQPEIFCRSCHVEVGLAGGSIRARAAYHTGQPLWLLNHGRAARQTLQSCTSCHTQRDCMTCHSSSGWKVNPHGPSFNAAAMYRANRLMCMRCHLTDPMTAGGR